VAVNKYGEPTPIQLNDPAQARAWQRVLLANEWFDGEDAIAASAQQAMLASWNTVQPTVVTMVHYSDMAQARREFPSRARAEQYADYIEGHYGDRVLVMVGPKRG
jgi:hypothetical protein